MIDNRVAARVATHCCFAAASPHHRFSRARSTTPTAPPRARSTPHLLPRTSRTTAPRKPRRNPSVYVHHTPATCTRLVWPRGFTCDGYREARSGKSTRNRAVVSDSAIPHNIQVKSSRDEGHRKTFTLKCGKFSQ